MGWKAVPQPWAGSCKTSVPKVAVGLPDEKKATATARYMHKCICWYYKNRYVAVWLLTAHCSAYSCTKRPLYSNISHQFLTEQKSCISVVFRLKRLHSHNNLTVNISLKFKIRWATVVQTFSNSYKSDHSTSIQVNVTNVLINSNSFTFYIIYV